MSRGPEESCGPTKSSGVIVGVDVGGTFTDVFAIDRASGRATIAKVPTTPENQAEGFARGVAAGAGAAARITAIVHGTTVGTNALLQRRGGRTGMIVTEGFRDVLEMRRRDRPQTWGLRGSYAPVIARDFSIEVAERTLADGTVRQAVDAEQVRSGASMPNARSAASSSASTKRPPRRRSWPMSARRSASTPPRRRRP